MRHKLLLAVLSLLCLPAICSAATAVYPMPPASGTTINGTGIGTWDNVGAKIVPLGDITGDQYPDFMYAANYGGSAKHIYIIKGSAAGLPPVLNSWDIWTPGKVPNASVITENDSYTQCGLFVAGGGDLNGDKINDLAFTCRNQAGLRTYYVVYGSANLPQIIKTTDIGFAVPGVRFTFTGPTDSSWDDYIAFGDIDGDNKSDLVLGYGLQRQLYVIKGGQTFTPGAIITLNEAYFNGTNGFVAKLEPQAGYYYPFAVTLIDINGDGRKDIVFGQQTYVSGGNKDRMFLILFGKPTMPAIVNVSNAAVDGIKIGRINTDSMAPLDMQDVGDVNLDGYRDLAIANASSYSDPEVDLIFGKAAWNPAGDTVIFDGKDGSRINGLGFFYLLGLKPDSGRYIFASTAGDFNNDGIKDLIIGSQYFARWSGTVSDAKIIMGQRLWPAKITLNTGYVDGIKAVQFSGPAGTGQSVGYIENIYGGIGCGLDSSYLVGSPRALGSSGQLFVANFKK